MSPESFIAIDAAARANLLLRECSVQRSASVDVVVQAEIGHLGGDASRKRASVEQRDRPHAALAGQERRPGRLEVAPERGDHSHSCYDDAPHTNFPRISRHGPGHDRPPETGEAPR